MDLPEFSGLPRDADLVKTSYVVQPWCECCGAFDPIYNYDKKIEMIRMICARCKYIWLMQPKWTIDRNEFLY